MRLEIDLNYIDLSYGNAALFGFDMEEPLVIILSGKETKFLNCEDNFDELDFNKVWSYGMLEFSVRNLNLILVNLIISYFFYLLNSYYIYIYI